MSSSSSHQPKPTAKPRGNVQVQQVKTQDGTCELCEEATATNKCVECEQWMCDRCKRLHTKQKATAHHEFTSLDEQLGRLRVDDTHYSPPSAGNDNSAAKANVAAATADDEDDTVEETKQNQQVRHF